MKTLAKTLVLSSFTLAACLLMQDRSLHRSV
jgi:hypothetical protein